MGEVAAEAGGNGFAYLWCGAGSGSMPEAARARGLG